MKKSFLLGSFLLAVGCGVPLEEPAESSGEREVVTAIPPMGTCAGRTGTFPIKPGANSAVCPPYSNASVYLIPHPSDEALGMSGAIRADVAAGKQVFLEVLTRGETSGVRTILNNKKTDTWHSESHSYSLTVAAFGDAMVREVLDSASQMGVAGVYVSTFPGGTLTAANTDTRIRFWKDNATGLALRGTAGTQDPGTVGGAAHAEHVSVWNAMVSAGVPDSRGYAVFRYRTGSGTPNVTVPLGNLCTPKTNGFSAYKLWAPTDGRYAIGYHSVKDIFDRAANSCYEYYYTAVPPTEPPPVDGGTPPMDGGVPPMDGGTPPMDGGTPPTPPPSTPEGGQYDYLATSPCPVHPTTLAQVCGPYNRPIVFFVPHPDDETIGMAGIIRKEVLSGRTVIVEAMTHGEASGVLAILKDGKTHTWHNGRHNYSMTVKKFGDIHINEFRDAMARLGVTAIYVNNFGNGNLTAAEVRTRVDHWIRRGDAGLSIRGTGGDQDPSTPGGTPHFEHKEVWTALTQTGFADLKGYLVYHYSKYQGRPDLKLDITPTCAAKRDALNAYKYWNPAQERFACAYHSVPAMLDNAAKDCNEYEVRP